MLKNILFFSRFFLMLFLVSSLSGCGHRNNSYVVSSSYGPIAIISDSTQQTVGQAYAGFATAISDARDGKAYFYLNIDDSRDLLYIPLEYMEPASVEPQFNISTFSLNYIYINPGVDISIMRDGEYQLVAQFNDTIGLIEFTLNVNNGYLFQLGTNCVYVEQQDVVQVPFGINIG